MLDTESQPAFSKTVVINASPSAVWSALTDPRLMQQWMAGSEIEIITDWQVGGPIVIRGVSNTIPFENTGTVLQFEPDSVLNYTHLSSLSHLPDIPASYSIIEFALMPTEQHTALTVILTNFPTESIHKHLAFYWNVAIELLKQFVENNLVTSS